MLPRTQWSLLRGNEAYREALRRANENTPAAATFSELSPIYSLGPEWPPLEFNGTDDEEMLDNLERYLKQRIATRNTLVENHQEQVEKFRARLVDIEKENIVLREENNRLKGFRDGERRRIKDLETRLVNAEAANNSLQRKNVALVDAKSVLEKELDDKELQMNAKKREQLKEQRKLRSQMSKQEVINSNLAQRLNHERKEKENRLHDQFKLRAVRKLVSDDTNSKVVMSKTISDPDVSTLERETRWNRKALLGAKSNLDVSKTPVPTPRRVRML